MNVTDILYAKALGGNGGGGGDVGKCEFTVQ